MSKTVKLSFISQVDFSFHFKSIVVHSHYMNLNIQINQVEATLTEQRDWRLLRRRFGEGVWPSRGEIETRILKSNWTRLTKKEKETFRETFGLLRFESISDIKLN